MDRNDNQRTLLTIKIKNKMENMSMLNLLKSVDDIIETQESRIQTLKSTIQIQEDIIKLKNNRIKMLEEEMAAWKGEI